MATAIYSTYLFVVRRLRVGELCHVAVVSSRVVVPHRFELRLQDLRAREEERTQFGFASEVLQHVIHQMDS